MKEKIEIIKSKRRTVAVEIKPDLRVIVRAPLHMKQSEIQRFIVEKTPWIEGHLEIMRKRMEKAQTACGEPISGEEVRALGQKALRVIVPIVERYARIIGVTYGRITVRNQVSRWGSCSSKGNLNFNCLLMLCPDEVTEYVIIHELCHRRHMNHSAEFWKTVEAYCPDYERHKRWLKDNGGALIERMKAAK